MHLLTSKKIGEVTSVFINRENLQRTKRKKLTKTDNLNLLNSSSEDFYTDDITFPKKYKEKRKALRSIGGFN